MSGPTGIYTEEEALNWHMHSENLSNDLLTICDKNTPVIDLGCGDGFYVNKFIEGGFSAIGIDGYKMESFNNSFIVHDLTKPINLKTKGTVVCLEVGEHIPKEYEDQLIKNIVNNCANRIILSWAVVGQNGINHVNCQNNDYIIDKFKVFKFSLNDELTSRLRNNIEVSRVHFRTTLMVFDRNE